MTRIKTETIEPAMVKTIFMMASVALLSDFNVPKSVKSMATGRAPILKSSNVDAVVLEVNSKGINDPNKNMKTMNIIATMEVQ